MSYVVSHIHLVILWIWLMSPRLNRLGKCHYNEKPSRQRKISNSVKYIIFFPSKFMMYRKHFFMILKFIQTLLILFCNTVTMKMVTNPCNESDWLSLCAFRHVMFWCMSILVWVCDAVYLCVYVCTFTEINPIEGGIKLVFKKTRKKIK